MPTPRPRTKEEKKRISEGVRRYYRLRRGEFILTRNKTRYQDPYNYSRAMRFVFVNMEKSNMPEGNKKLMRQYYEYLQARGLEKGTVYKEMSNMWRMFKNLDKGFRKLTRQDIIKIVLEIDNRTNGQTGRPISAATKGCLKTTLRNFFGKFLGRHGLVEWIRVKAVVRNERYYGIEKIKEIVDSVDTFEERVFLSLLWEGDFRVGEIMVLEKEDIVFEPGYMVVHVSGKTGYRAVCILRKGTAFPLGSFGLMKKFVRMRDGRRIWSFESYNQVEYLFKKLRERHNLPVHSHLFRKCRATYLDILGLPLSHICINGGWSINSEVVKRYILTSGRYLVPSLERINSMKRNLYA